MEPRCEARIDCNGSSYLCELFAGHEGEHENSGLEWTNEEELRRCSHGVSVNAHCERCDT